MNNKDLGNIAQACITAVVELCLCEEDKELHIQLTNKEPGQLQFRPYTDKEGNNFITFRFVAEEPPRIIVPPPGTKFSRPN